MKLGFFLRYFLSFSLVVSSPTFALPSTVGQSTLSKIEQEYYSQLFERSPILEDFMRAPNFSKEMLPKYERSSSLLDSDPFFMRSQNWISKPVASDQSMEIQVHESSVAVGVSSWNKALKINLPLKPLLLTDEYAFFSLKQESPLFFDKSPKEVGEGFFFISRSDLAVAYQNSKKVTPQSSAHAVPVYFFAMPGAGWTGKIKSFEWAEVNQLVFYNRVTQKPLPIGVEDVRAIEKSMKINLAFSRIQTLMANKGNKKSIEQIMFPYPAEGSTAAFGTFLTGINLGNDRGSIVKLQPSKIKKIVVKVLAEVFPKQAHADITQYITPDFMDRMLVLSAMLSGGMAASIYLKYAKYKDLFDKKYKVEGLEEKGLFVRLWEREKKAAKSVFDIFSHALATMSSFISINIIDTLEYVGDKYASHLMGPKNGILRRAFNNTMGWTRETSLNLAINYKTFFLGAIVMGAVDSGLVALQLLYVTPYLLNHTSVGEWTNYDQIANSENSQQNTEAEARLVTGEIIRNVVGYLMGGAIGYSHEQRMIANDRVQHMVDNQLKREGLDPHDKEVQDRRKSMFDEQMNVAMKQLGLPDKDEFLFDMGTVQKKKKMKKGFSVSELGVGSKTSGAFLFEVGRYGVINVVLNKTISQSKQFQEMTNSELGQDVTNLFQQMRDLLSIKNTFMNKKKKELAKDVRRTLTLFSYVEADVERWVEFVPASIKEIAGSEEALRAAAVLFNANLFGHLDGDKYVLNKNEAWSKETGRTVSMEGDEVLASLRGGDPFSRHVNHARAVDLHVKNEILEEEIAAYKPTKLSMVEQWQKRRAQKKTEVALKEQGILEGSKDYAKVYKEQFALNLSKIVNLHVIKDTKFYDQVTEQAEINTNQQLGKKEEGSYLSQLSATEKEDYKTWVYAKNFLETYNHLAVDNDDYIEALSPEAPGAFQKWRQKLEGNGTFKVMAKRTLRWIEAFSSTRSSDTGFGAMVDRYIPFAHDLRHNFVRDLRFYPYILSFGYLSSYYIMQTKIDYPLWAFFVSLGPLALGAVELLNRMMKNFGVKPMGGVWEKVRYSFMHSWLTYPMLIPVMAWAGPITAWWADNITSPIAQNPEYVAGAAAATFLSIWGSKESRVKAVKKGVQQLKSGLKSCVQALTGT